MRFHTTIYSFVQYGFKQKSTWIAIIGIFLYFEFNKEIHHLANKFIDSDRAIDLIVLCVTGFLAGFKGFKNDK